MLVLAAMLGWTPPVQRPHDEPPALALSWASAGAAACPSRTAVVERVAAQGVAGRIGDWVPERHARAGLAVEVEVAVEGQRWRADLRLRDADGESTRSFSAASCEALAEATALIVAVTLDPIAVASTHASVGASATTSAPEPEPEPEPRPVVVVEEPEESPADYALPTAEPDPQRWPDELRVGLSIHGGGGWGPVLAAGAVGGRLAVFGPRWRIEVGGRYAIPRRIRSQEAVIPDPGAPEPADAGTSDAVFDGWFVEARGCFVPGLRRLEFPLCPGVELGSVRGRGVSPVVNPSERSFLWVAPGVSQGLSWAPVERLAIGVELGLVAPLTRGRFTVGDAVVGELAVVGARALAIVELRLP